VVDKAAMVVTVITPGSSTNFSPTNQPTNRYMVITVMRDKRSKKIIYNPILYNGHSSKQYRYQYCGTKRAERDQTTLSPQIMLGAQDLVPVLAVLQGPVTFASSLLWQASQILDHKLPIPL
jgi:hypothetical protein